MTPPQALAGIRVLDLSDESGASCGKLLADMGADVILVEPPGGLPARTIGPFYGRPHPDRSLFFWHDATNKRSIELDLVRATDRACFLRLVATADVLITTGPPHRLDAAGLPVAALAGRNPRLIVASITPFGTGNPGESPRSGDLVLQAAGGMLFLNGTPDRAPLQGFGLPAYRCAGLHAAIGVLLALLGRMRTGHGQCVDVSIQASVATAVAHATSAFHTDGTIIERSGSLHWSRDFRIGRCRDGHVLHGTLGDWTSLLEWVKADDAACDLDAPEWRELAYRRTHCTHLFEVLDAWAAGYGVAELVEGAQLRRLPYAAVQPLAALPHHPQLRARGFFVPVRHSDLDAVVRYPGAPYRFSATPWRVTRRPPSVGEHTAAVRASVAGRTPTPPPAAASSLRTPALAGVRVLDFTWVVAGPVATRILADHGADVVKIEHPGTAEVGDRHRGLTGSLNRGKRSLIIDMRHPEGREVVRRIVPHTDVVIDNFSPRVMRQWEFAYDDLRRLRGDIIAVSLSGFGATGPRQHDVSYGPTLQALAGFPHAMRYPGQPPTGWGFAYADIIAGTSAALAVLLALWHRRRTGAGQSVDIAQFETLAAVIGPHLLGACAGTAVAHPDAVGNASQERPAAPHGVYRCADRPVPGPARDRWCALAVFGDDDWARFRRAAGDPAWARAPRFRTHDMRTHAAPDLDAAIEAWTRPLRAETVAARLQEAGLAAAVVADPADLAADRRLRARGYWVDVPTPDGSRVVYDGSPIRLSATPAALASRAPSLGEHTAEVLQELLGLEPDAIAALRAAGVIR